MSGTPGSSPKDLTLNVSMSSLGLLGHPRSLLVPYVLIMITGLLSGLQHQFYIIVIFTQTSRRSGFECKVYTPVTRSIHFCEQITPCRTIYCPNLILGSRSRIMCHRSDLYLRPLFRPITDPQGSR